MARSRKRKKSAKSEAAAAQTPQFINISTNRRARFEYEILDELEAGIVLTGSEIKSIRAGKADISNAYVRISDGEAWLQGAHIAAYDNAGLYGQHEPARHRKLLLRRSEIARLNERVAQAGLTIIVLRLYIARGKAKLGIALARGRKRYDKREAIRQREHNREIDRAVRRAMR